MLPLIDTLDAYRPIYRDVNIWLPALQAICRRHALDSSTLRQAPPGSNVVFWVDPGCLIKLFAPMWVADATREAAALHALGELPGIAVPRIVAEGQLEGWPYLIITRLPGRPLDEVWSELSARQHLDLAACLGRLIADLHRAPAAGLGLLLQDWPAFIRGQAAGCLARQRAIGTPANWLPQLEVFLADLPPLAEPGFQPVLLHADLNPEHLFCDQGPAGWQITGVIDFGDAMLGHPYYDFVAPGFLLGAEPDLRRAMLLAYGFTPEALNPGLSRQMMAYTLLHRFASLPEMLARFGANQPATMAELESALWGFQA